MLALTLYFFIYGTCLLLYVSMRYKVSEVLKGSVLVLALIILGRWTGWGGWVVVVVGGHNM